MTPSRNNAFVPLISTPHASADEHAEFLATVLSQPGEVQQFCSPEAGGSALPNASGRAGTCEPKVSLQRVGNRVTGIHIQCSCGEVIDLACAYQEPTAPSAPVA